MCFFNFAESLLYFSDSLAFSYLAGNADQGIIFFGDLRGQ
jgi:hypothetical protein